VNIYSKSYFNWLCKFIKPIPNHYSYKNLLIHLHNTKFEYLIPMDANRAEDGIDLRRRYYYISNDLYTIDLKQEDFFNEPCTVLEMMVALSLRCEECIMGSSEEGLQVGRWFWDMIANLGLDKMHDGNYDDEKVDYILNRLLKRTYNSDGVGGLFTVNHCDVDIRSVEIWYQLCWYLNENYV